MVNKVLCELKMNNIMTDSGIRE